MRAVNKTKKTKAAVKAPPSKAHTLRAVILASLAEGQSRISNPLLAEDQLNVIECLRKLGIAIEISEQYLLVTGLGGSFRPTALILDVGESGVGMNFLASLGCFADQAVTLTGAGRILERPIGDVVNGVRQLGGYIKYLGREGFPPVECGLSGLQGGRAVMSGQKNSQYFSSLLIASALAQNDVTLVCSDHLTEKPYIDITLQMMRRFGVQAHNRDYREFFIKGNQSYQAVSVEIEGDYSSASFFILAAAITGMEITIDNLARGSVQGDKRMLDLAGQMGCRVIKEERRVIVRGNPLKPVEIDMSDVPDLVPPAALMAAFAGGTSRLTHIGHLRFKECDRLGVMAEELAKMGVKADCERDALVVHGTSCAHGAEIDPHNDHRIAMSFAVAGLVTGGQTIRDPACVAKSFPDFWQRFKVLEST